MESVGRTEIRPFPKGNFGAVVGLWQPAQDVELVAGIVSLFFCYVRVSIRVCQSQSYLGSRFTRLTRTLLANDQATRANTE